MTLYNFDRDRTILLRLPEAPQDPHGRPVHAATKHQEYDLFSVTRKRRSAQGTLEPPLPYEVYNGIIFVYKPINPEENLFDVNKLKTICAIDTDILSASSYFTEYCNGIFDDTTGTVVQCYSSSSLGNYVALLNNRKSCQDITDHDVSTVKNLLLNCSFYFEKQTLKSNCYSSTSGVNGTTGSSCTNVPAECTKYNAVYNIFHYLVDNEMGASNDMFLKYTVSLPAGSYDDRVYDDLYNE